MALTINERKIFRNQLVERTERNISVDSHVIFGLLNFRKKKICLFPTPKWIRIDFNMYSSFFDYYIFIDKLLLFKVHSFLYSRNVRYLFTICNYTGYRRTLHSILFFFSFLWSILFRFFFLCGICVLTNNDNIWVGCLLCAW